jgi:hypothetical protein
MCNISQSCDQTFVVNCGPRSEVIVSGTPKGVIQEKTKVHAHATVDVSESGIAVAVAVACAEFAAELVRVG